MGGSNNSLKYPTVSKDEVIRKIQESKGGTAQNEYEIQISDLLDKLLLHINNRDTQAIQTHLDVIISALNDQIDGTIATKFGGSLSKHTHLNGISDVDALIILNKSEFATMTPPEVLKSFFKILQNRLPKTGIELGDTAITIHYSDGDVQLIPAIRYKTGVKIPDDKEWSTIIRPETFSAQLSNINSQLNGRLIPAIKIIKGIISGFPDKSQLKGYHVESLALQVFENFKTDDFKLKSLVSEFFKKAPQIVRKPIKDMTGQSAFVDEYLGKKDSISRLVVADNLERTYRQIEMADTGRLISVWSELISHM
jgi:hypothetical protein